MSSRVDADVTDTTQVQFQAVWEAWLRKNREQEALQSAKWARIGLIVLPIFFAGLAIVWHFEAH